MSTEKKIVARSPRWHRQELLAANRFLRTPYGLLAVVLALPVLVLWGLWSGFDAIPLLWLPLVWAVSWLLIELCFLPRRLAIIRVARQESRDEVTREALRHGVSLDEVKVID